MPDSAPFSPIAPVLCVDLDGTLVRTDTALECMALLLKTNPFAMLVACWVLVTRGALPAKRYLADRVRPNPKLLPYDPRVLMEIEDARRGQRRVVLATAADHRIARSVADHLNCFDEVLASDRVNLKGERKRDALNTAFGEKGWDYIGDSAADRPLFRSANVATTVGRGVRGLPQLRRWTRSAGGLRTWTRAIRAYQWVKNALIAVPMFAAHQWGNSAAQLAVIAGFVCFSLAASSAYLLNDLVDLEADRLHEHKRNRPLASGELSIASGFLGSAVLMVLALGLSIALLPALFTVVLLLYVGTTLLYSFYLKRKPVVDVFTLAGLYSLRVVAGGVATGIELSMYLLGFVLFLFFSLACAKRLSEIRSQGSARGYASTDGDFVREFGTVSGYGAVLILGIYVSDTPSHAVYTHGQLLWGLCPILMYWITRVWFITHRGQMHHDPIVFAFRDSVSRICLAVAAALTVCSL